MKKVNIMKLEKINQIFSNMDWLDEKIKEMKYLKEEMNSQIYFIKH